MTITIEEAEAQVQAHRSLLRGREVDLQRPVSNGERRDLIRQLRQLESDLAFWERELDRATNGSPEKG